MRSPVKVRKSPRRKDKQVGEKYIKIPLILTEQGFFICEIRINKIKGLFLLDTGSNATCIDLILKNKFKITSNEISDAVSVTNSIQVETSLNNEVSIGGIKLKNTKIDIIDLTNVKESIGDPQIKDISGILGNRILNSFNSIIKYKEKLLYIKK
jgi:predicted aspartyl protease